MLLKECVVGVGHGVIQRGKLREAHIRATDEKERNYLYHVREEELQYAYA